MWTFAFRTMRHLSVGPLTLLVYIHYCLVYLARRYVGEWLYVLVGLPFIPVNIVYNWVVGTYIFWELPREGGYTGRVKRHLKLGCRFAKHIARLLNVPDPEHVDLGEFGIDCRE